MKVKVCGLNPIKDVQLCIKLKVFMLGFVFFEKSPRNIKNLKDIQKLKDYKKEDSSFVAVTVNPNNKFIEKTVLNNFDYIQLHGSETCERVREIKSMGIKIIKAIKIRADADIDEYKKYEDAGADIILFDTPGMEKSIEFPKDLISKLPKGDRYALAGSISIDNVENISKLGVNFFDLSSNLEKKLGHKDHIKIQNFMKKISSIDENSPF